MVSADDFHPWLQGLIQHRVQDTQQPKSETMGNAHARSIFRPVQFLRDTFTAKDLKSDNMHKPQCAEESDSNTWEPQERRAN